MILERFKGARKISSLVLFNRNWIVGKLLRAVEISLWCSGLHCVCRKSIDKNRANSVYGTFGVLRTLSVTWKWKCLHRNIQTETKNAKWPPGDDRQNRTCAYGFLKPYSESSRVCTNVLGRLFVPIRYEWRNTTVKFLTNKKASNGNARWISWKKTSYDLTVWNLTDSRSAHLAEVNTVR